MRAAPHAIGSRYEIAATNLYPRQSDSLDGTRLAGIASEPSPLAPARYPGEKNVPCWSAYWELDSCCMEKEGCKATACVRQTLFGMFGLAAWPGNHPGSTCY